MGTIPTIILSVLIAGLAGLAYRYRTLITKNGYRLGQMVAKWIPDDKLEPYIAEFLRGLANGITDSPTATQAKATAEPNRFAIQFSKK